MSICYDFEKWTMITLASVAICLSIGLVGLVSGQTTKWNMEYIGEHGQLSATPDGIRMKQLGIIVLDNANMLEKHTNILEICNLEFKNLDFTHFDSCYSFSESYNTMLRNFDNATEEYAIDIMGFGK